MTNRIKGTDNDQDAIEKDQDVWKDFFITFTHIYATPSSDVARHPAEESRHYNNQVDRL